MLKLRIPSAVTKAGISQINLKKKEEELTPNSAQLGSNWTGILAQVICSSSPFKPVLYNHTLPSLLLFPLVVEYFVLY